MGAALTVALEPALAPQDDHQRLVTKAFSNDDAGELARAKQEVAFRDAKIKKLDDALRKEKELQKQGYEAASKIDSRLALSHAEREEARKGQVTAERRLEAELGERDEQIRRLEDRLALFAGDTGVPAHEIERALKMVRSAAGDGAGGAEEGAGLRLADTDLSALGLAPLAKKEVQNILLQNNELIKDLEKTELLLKTQTKIAATTMAELEAVKRSGNEEVSRMKLREVQKTSELADSKRQLMQLQEAYAGREGGGAGARPSLKQGVTASGFPRSLLPPGVDTESIADSVISEDSAVDVRPDENIFELRVLRAQLDSNSFAARPSTFVSFDFYQHDTQASPMRQGLEPEYDFIAQYVLSVDDLFLHYTATTVLAIEVYQSLGVECALVGRTDAPLRELLQGRRGRIVKHAQLYAVADAASSGAPRAIGTLVYEFRMRRRVDAAVHSFMQRFPDVAALAMQEVRPGARTSEAIVTVKSCSGLRLRLGGPARPAPYVHFDFFEFGEHETASKESADPVYEQSFRFPVDRDGDFSEYVKQTSLKFSVFDEADDDTVEAVLGQAELPLAPLLASPLLANASLPLLDTNGRQSGTISVVVEIREQTQPKQISLRSGGAGMAKGSADDAAVRIQSLYRGKAIRNSGVGQAHSREVAAPLTVGVQTLKLAEDVLRQPGLAAVWVEIDMAGLSAEPLRTKRAQPRAETPLDFTHTMPVVSQGREADALRRALTSYQAQDADVSVLVMAQGASGTRQLGTGYMSLKDMHERGTDLGGGTLVALTGGEKRRIGTVEMTLSALAASHRAVAPDALRVGVGQLTLPDDLVRDQAISELWIEVDLSCVGVTKGVNTRAVAKAASERAPLELDFTHTVPAPPGSPALAALQAALASANPDDSDVYFVLKARGRASDRGRGARGAVADTEEICEGYVNLAQLLAQKRDLVNHPIALEKKAPRGGEPATLSVSLLAYEALRRIKAPVAQSDAIRIDVGELTMSDSLTTDGQVMEVWVEVDVLDLDGGAPLRTQPLHKNARRLDFEFTQLLPATAEGGQLESLRVALGAKESESADVFFILKGRGTRGEKELAHGYAPCSLGHTPLAACHAPAFFGKIVHPHADVILPVRHVAVTSRSRSSFPTGATTSACPSRSSPRSDLARTALSSCRWSPSMCSRRPSRCAPRAVRTRCGSRWPPLSCCQVWSPSPMRRCGWRSMCSAWPRRRS